MVVIAPSGGAESTPRELHRPVRTLVRRAEWAVDELNAMTVGPELSLCGEESRVSASEEVRHDGRHISPGREDSDGGHGLNAARRSAVMSPFAPSHKDLAPIQQPTHGGAKKKRCRAEY